MGRLFCVRLTRGLVVKSAAMMRPEFTTAVSPRPMNQSMLKSAPMITAHVNELGIVLRFDSLSDNLSQEEWEALLDELKSHHIPSFYGHEKRMHMDFEGVKEGQPRRLRVVIYFTPNTVAMDDAIAILKRRDINVFDVRAAVC